MQQGDPVLVKNMDGEQARAVIAEITDKVAAEATIPKGDEEVSVSRYWGGSVDPDEGIVVVRFLKTVTHDNRPAGYGEKTYSYPESKVEPQDTGREG